jgi:5-carboxymethyl-2-hydroxymuconate isomerase
MPHLSLEVSANVAKGVSPERVLRELVSVISGFDTIDSASVKAYFTRREDWAMGDGAAPGFVHLSVAILSGRPAALRQEMAAGLYEVLRSAFASSLSDALAAITVEIREMDRETYIK